MKGNRNTEGYMKLFTVIALALLLLYELLSGKIYYYVHPRYFPGIWFAVIVLFLFAASMLGELKKGRHNAGSKQYLLYLLPVVLALLFPAMEGGGNVAIAQNSGKSSLYGSNTADKAGNSKEDTLKDDSAGTDSSEDTQSSSTDNSIDGTAENPEDSAPVETPVPEEKDKSLKYKNKDKDGTTLISDDEYGGWYYELFDYLKDFKGKRYRFTAQVFTMDGLKASQFLAGRYIMTCCALDLTGYGIITESDLSSKLKENEWITVTGTIGEYNYKGSMVPILKDVVISKTKAPKEEYVYYYY